MRLRWTISICISLFTCIINGCIAVPVPLLPGDGIYKVEADVEQLIENKKTKIDVINELGIPLKYRADSMSYKACRESGGVGLLICIGYMYAACELQESREKPVCIELILNFNQNNILVGYEEIPWVNNIDQNNERLMISRLAIEGDKPAMHIIELSKSYTDYPEYEKYLLTHLDNGDNVPNTAWILFLHRGKEPEDIDLLCKAADGGIIKAQNYLGRFYSSGEGVPQDLRKAYMWYKLAATDPRINDEYHNSVREDSNIDLIFLKKSMSAEELIEAEDLYINWEPGKCQTDLHNTEKNKPAYMYRKYKYIYRNWGDPIIAWKWLCKSADHGYGKAQIEVAYWYRESNWKYADVARLAWIQKAVLHADDRIAYLWYTRAAKGKVSKLEIRDILFQPILSDSELAEADEMVSNWKPGQCEQALLGMKHKTPDLIENAPARLLLKDIDNYCPIS